MALYVPPNTVASEYAFVPRYPMTAPLYPHTPISPISPISPCARPFPMNFVSAPAPVSTHSPARMYPFPVHSLNAARALRRSNLRAAPVYPLATITAPLKHQRVVIFDWDDTLFPTSAWVSSDRNSSKLNKSADLAALRRVGKAVYDVLAYYLKLFGAKNVRVVTNGTKEWVLKSLTRCSRRYRELCVGEEKMPDLDADADHFAAIYNSFVSLDILVSSARDMHSQKFPQHGASWKMRAFKSIAKRHFNLFSSSDNNVYEIVSIGDSEDEFVASFETKRMLETQNRLNRNNNVVRLHRVKLKKHPRIEDILSQIAMLTVEAEALLHAEEPITIRCDPAPTDIGV